MREAEWHPEFQAGDSILDIEHFRAGSRHLGPNVTVQEVRDGLYDLILCWPDVRTEGVADLLRWLDQQPWPITADGPRTQMTRSEQPV